MVFFHEFINLVNIFYVTTTIILINLIERIWHTWVIGFTLRVIEWFISIIYVGVCCLIIHCYILRCFISWVISAIFRSICLCSVCCDIHFTWVMRGRIRCIVRRIINDWRHRVYQLFHSDVSNHYSIAISVSDPLKSNLVTPYFSLNIVSRSIKSTTVVVKWVDKFSVPKNCDSCALKQERNLWNPIEFDLIFLNICKIEFLIIDLVNIERVYINKLPTACDSFKGRAVALTYH